MANQEYNLDELKELGRGSFNIVYDLPADSVENVGHCVLRIPKQSIEWYESQGFEITKDQLANMSLDEVFRTAQLWNQVNTSMRPAQVVNTSKEAGCLLPFIRGEDVPSSSDDIKHCMNEIYINTGRIVLDPWVEGNFKRLESGEVICVDVNLALDMRGVGFDKVYSIEHDKHASRARSTSFATRENHETYAQTLFENRFSQNKQLENNADTKTLFHFTKALIFVSQHFPFISDTSFLLNDKDLCRRLAISLDKTNLNAEDSKALISIQTHQRIYAYAKTFIDYKNFHQDVCVDTKCFPVKMLTKVYQKINQTRRKAQVAESIIQGIFNAGDTSQVKDFLEKKMQEMKGKPGIFTGKIKKMIKRCIKDIELSNPESSLKNTSSPNARIRP